MFRNSFLLLNLGLKSVLQSNRLPLSRLRLGVTASIIALSASATCILAEAPVPTTDDALKPLENVAEPVTGIKFPRFLSFAYAEGESNAHLDLIGLGIRQVTFMYFNAYTVGLYLDKKAQSFIRSSARWSQEYSPEKLIKGSPEASWFYSNLLSRGHGLSLLIQTCRKTDAPHLRNGFIKFLSERAGRERLTDAEREQILKDLDDFRLAFPTGAFEGGDWIRVTRLPDGHLSMDFATTKKGVERKSLVIANPKLAQWFFEGYLHPKRPISPSLISSVAKGFARLLDQ